jgi:copper-containing nitrite reductase
VRAPPPIVASASWTSTCQPASASVTAAASPFGPDPITTARLIRAIYARGPSAESVETRTASPWSARTRTTPSAPTVRLEPTKEERVAMGYPASTPLHGTLRPKRGPRTDATPFLMVAVLLLGLAVAVLIVTGVWLAASASDAKQEARAARLDASTVATQTMPGMEMGGTATAATPSFAAAAPANAAELAAAHKAYPAELPAAPAGVANVQLTLKDVTIQVAPGIKYAAWGFAGGAPGPVIHVRQGQKVHIRLTNGGTIPHSVDFHAARIAPNVAFKDVMPGKSIDYTFVANDPGVFMYHCGTKPVLAHIANGMYGAIVVEPKGLPPADHDYVLVSSEWYLGSDGLGKPAQFDMAKAHEMHPDWVTWNGYAGQYVAHPLTAKPGETVRFWVVAAGPSFDTDFHVVGTVLNRAWANGDMSQFQRNVQTVSVPAGGGGVFDVKIDQPGLYPFVSHSFASVDLGQVGLLKVGDVKGTMSH